MANAFLHTDPLVAPDHAEPFFDPENRFANLSGDVSAARNTLVSGKPIPQAINYPPVDRAADALVEGAIEPGKQLVDWASQQRGDNPPSLGAALGPATMAAIGFLPGPKGVGAVKAVAPEARTVGKLPVLAAPEHAEPFFQPITAYHGSPHDFERFDMSKIGSGEGAQAYGHGLYFAENEGVARDYRNNLAGLPYKQLDAAKLDPEKLAPVTGFSPEAIAMAKEELGQMGNDPVATAAMLESLHLNVGYPRAKEAAQVIRSMQPSWTETQPGRMYQVAINADPDSFLHWDKPLSEQSEHVRKALAGARTKGARFPAEEHAPTGADIVDAIRSFAGRDPVKATQALREAGIPGIKYLDQGSRFQPQQVEHLNTQIKGLEDMLAGASETKRPGIEAALKARRSELSDLQPTHNYVVFDDKMIDILKKYGLAGLGIPAFGAAAGQDQR